MDEAQEAAQALGQLPPPGSGSAAEAGYRHPAAVS